MSGIQNYGITFNGNYLIPYNQMRDSKQVGALGAETAKFVQNPNDIAQTKDGIVVKIDDTREKEYNAVVSKYGINIQKYNKPVVPISNETIEERTYRYMVTKLDENSANEKIENFKKMDAKARNIEFMNTFKEFKASEKMKQSG